MAKKLEERLKERGYTDADLEALKPLLSDAKFRAAMDAEADALEATAADRDKFKGESESWAKWHQETAIPTVDKALKDAADARAEAAASDARLKAMQEYGLTKIAEARGEDVDPPKPKAGEPEPFDPKKHNLVTLDDIQTFADKEGEAIALAQDLATEHYELTGKRLPSMRELRAEAKKAGKLVEQYWQEKYKIPELRVAKEAKAKEDYEKSIRDDQRAKDISEFANPMARPPSISKNPFTTRPEGGKQPWENQNERSVERVNKALKTILQ